MALDVAIVCQDEATLQWACDYFERTATPTGSGATLSKCWKMGDLSDPKVLACAVSAARQANVIVVSMQAGAQLSLAFFMWLEGWLPHRTRAGGSFVALLGVAQSPGVHSDLQQCLRSIARLGGLDFYLEEHVVPSEPNPVGSRASPKAKAQRRLRT